jgi:hypothetical protein
VILGKMRAVLKATVKILNKCEPSKIGYDFIANLGYTETRLPLHIVGHDCQCMGTGRIQTMSNTT